MQYFQSIYIHIQYLTKQMKLTAVSNFMLIS